MEILKNQGDIYNWNALKACICNEGLSVDKALTYMGLRKGITIRKRRKKKKVVSQVKWTQEYRDKCKSNGISISTAQSRVYTYGWDIESACSVPVQVNKRSQQSAN